MKIKKTILYTAFLLAASGSIFTSCEDMFGGFLDKQPSNELTEEEVFSDWTTAAQFHDDTYNFFRHGAGRIDATWLDAATDLGETSYARGVKVSFNIGNFYGSQGWAELGATWEHYYRGIRKCNMTLERIDNVPKNPSHSEEKYIADKARLKAEARFFRAFFYWELFLRYGPIPVVTEVLDPNGDLLSNYTTRPTVKEYVVDFILKELRECEGVPEENGTGLLTYEEANKMADAGRISQPMASAFYSRIMLYMASPRYSAESGISWVDAAEASKNFMDKYGQHYGLFKISDATGTAYTNAILRATYDGDNNETIIFRNDGKATWGAINNDTPVGEGGNGGFCPSQNLVDMYDMADGTSPFANYDETGAPVYSNMTPEINETSGYNDTQMWSNRDPRLSDAVLYHGVSWGNGVINVIRGMRDNPTGNANATPTGYYMRKYIPETILSSNHSGTSYRNWIFMRYAEVLLNYAEAMNEVHGPCQEVYDCLNQIRHRAGITGNVENRTDLTSSKENMRKFIRKERTVELAFEEHRPWDVRRWNVAVEALSRPVYGVNVEANGTITRKIAQERKFETKMYLYPIPEAEVWKTNIENNQGW